MFGAISLALALRSAQQQWTAVLHTSSSLIHGLVLKYASRSQVMSSTPFEPCSVEQQAFRAPLRVRLLAPGSHTVMADN